MKPSEQDMETARGIVSGAWVDSFERRELQKAIAAALAGEREQVFEQIEQRLIQEHASGDGGVDNYDDGWQEGAWNAVNAVRELRALNGGKP